MRPFSIKIFVPSGDPEGVRVVSRDEWPGQAVVCPRALLPEVPGSREYASAENFLREILLMLPLLGFWHFDDDREEEVEAEIQDEAQQEVTNKRAGKRAGMYSSLPRGMLFHFRGSTQLKASLELVESGVVVKAGSIAAIEPKQHFEIHGATYAAKRRELIESGILKAEGGELRFAEDQFFSSASAAASIVAGQNQNADHWVADDGSNLGDMLREARSKFGQPE